DRHLERDALARLDAHGVRIADLQLEIGALHDRAIADALDLETLLEAVGDALHHVRDQRARQAVQRAVLAALGRARDRDRAVVLRDLHPRRDGLPQLALRPRDRHAAGVDRDEHAGRDFNWLFPDPAHSSARPVVAGKEPRFFVCVDLMCFPLAILRQAKRQLPDVADDFAADALCLGGAARDDAAGRGHDRDPHAAEDPLAPVLAGIDAAARLRDTAETAQDALAAAAVFQLDDERRMRAVFRDVVVADVALLLEDARDLDLQL